MTLGKFPSLSNTNPRQQPAEAFLTPPLSLTFCFQTYFCFSSPSFLPPFHSFPSPFCLFCWGHTWWCSRLNAGSVLRECWQCSWDYMVPEIELKLFKQLPVSRSLSVSLPPLFPPPLFRVINFPEAVKSSAVPYTPTTLQWGCPLCSWLVERTELWKVTEKGPKCPCWFIYSLNHQMFPDYLSTLTQALRTRK